MEPMQERVQRMREERLAREKARIEKLRELNLKKYNKEHDLTSKVQNGSVKNLSVRLDSVKKIPSNPITTAKNTSSFNSLIKRPSTVPVFTRKPSVPNYFKPKSVKIDDSKTKSVKVDDSKSKLIKSDDSKAHNKIDESKAKSVKTDSIKPKLTKIYSSVPKTVKVVQKFDEIRPKLPQADPPQPKPYKKPTADSNANSSWQPQSTNTVTTKKPDSKSRQTLNFTKQNDRKSIAPSKQNYEIRKSIAPNIKDRKSMLPNTTAPNMKDRKTMLPNSIARKSMLPVSSTNKKDNVFDGLYKPKTITDRQLKTPIEKLQNDPKYRDKLIKQSNVIMKRQTVCEPARIRRSISAVHFKRISKDELPNCFHKWASIGDNLNKTHLSEINEDSKVLQDKVISAVKSDRKKVTFNRQTLGTPTPKELQSRLQSWLTKRGKSFDTYHHLQCFGLHHLALREKEVFDDEDKENVTPTKQDSDDSYEENMNTKTTVWRRNSLISSSDFNETKETLNSDEVEVHEVDELLNGALNDLADLLREGFDWEQAARWLRAIRERFPKATETAAYWECRAALEERQGNLPGSVQCWEEAIAKGTERSVAESNLDQLLDKFMQLKISPNSSAKKISHDTKMLDVKNVFKSTIIRFAVQQAKLRQSAQKTKPLQPQYIITPVRRSGRQSACKLGTRSPLLQICSSIRRLDKELLGATFVPNPTLPNTP